MTTSPSGFCGQCGARLAPDANFCRECGAESLHDRGFSSGATGYSDYEPSAYRPSTLTTDGTPIPGEMAGMGTRTGAFLISKVVVQVISFVPVVGWIIPLAAFVWTLILYQRGQDVGARITGVRDTGELAGFYHMWTRGLAACVSFIVIGAGFWTAYSDPNRQTWHDKWMGTYVVKAGPEVNDLPGTSSSAAKAWFWASLLIAVIMLVAVIMLIAAIAIAIAGIG